MAMRVNPRQIAGVYNGTLTEEITNIVSKAKTFDSPVATAADLPVNDNHDGDVRLVLDRNRLYLWDEPTATWYPDDDCMTEAKTISIPVTANNQKNFVTSLPVGVPDGVASLDTVVFYVNGLAQEQGVDYILGVTSLEPARLILEWVSSDFILEIEDKLQLNYDKLIIN